MVTNKLLCIENHCICHSSTGVIVEGGDFKIKGSFLHAIMVMQD